MGTEKQAARRRTHLQARLAKLRAEIETARERESELDEAITAAKEDLAEGSCGQGKVAAAVEALQKHRSGLVHLGAAAAKVQGELQEVEAAVQEQAHARERTRQARASQKLRAEAERCGPEFVSSLARVLAPLERRREIAAILARDYSLAPRLDPLDLKVVATALRAAMGGDLRREDPLAYVALVRRLVFGPCGLPWMPVPRNLSGELEQRYTLSDR